MNAVQASTRLVGRVCVVTGAASVLSAAVAERFAQEGGTVVGVDQRDHMVGERPSRIDLTDEDRVERFFADV